jgi:SAM-dependent methyltransferase
MSPSLDALTSPLPSWSPKNLRFAAVRALLGTVGRLSEGISIGHRHGFDSGVMLDHVYANQARGRTPLGRLIDRVYLNAPGWIGIRNRGALLERVIAEEVRRIASERGEAVVADLACGGGRYVLAALADAGRDVTVQATLRDYEAANVDKATANACRLGLAVTVERADAFSDRDLATLPRPDLVIVSGLHEIVADDETVRGHFGQIARVLSPGGRLVLTVQPDHPQGVGS